jgi:putative oxidoreductase
MFMSKYETQIYTILRIAAGFLFMWHGIQKLFGYPPIGIHLPLQIVIFGGGVEFLGGVLIMIGFVTRWAAFISSGEMAYAYWSAHGTHAILPLLNMGELAVLYCFLFLFISTRGSGIFSVDHYLGKNKYVKNG